MPNNDIETRVTEVEKKQAVTDAKFDAFIQEMRDFKNEMRQQNEMRAKEIDDLRKETNDKFRQMDEKFEKMNAKFDAKFEKMDAKFEKMNEKIDAKFNQLENKMESINQYAHQMFIAAAIGIGAMILTVVAPLIFSSIKSADKEVTEPKAAVETSIDRATLSEGVDHNG